MLRVLVGALLPAMLLAAPPPINKLALFPDKSAWCEAKNITQIVGHSGCEAKSIQNRWDPGVVGGRDEDTGPGGRKRTGLPVLASTVVTRTRWALLPQGVPGTVLQLQRSQYLPAVYRVPGALRLVHAGPVHVGDREYGCPLPPSFRPEPAPVWATSA